jgi:hypothetical protein
MQRHAGGERIGKDSKINEQERMEENLLFTAFDVKICRSHWPRGLKRRSAAAWLLGSRVRIPLAAWMFVVFIRCVVLCR